MRIEKNINLGIISWSNTKFSELTSWELYGWQWGEWQIWSESYRVNNSGELWLINRQYLSHMFTSVNPNINQLYESTGRVLKGSRKRLGLMNHESAELLIGLIFIKISNSPT